jgi:hypothetical protein
MILKVREISKTSGEVKKEKPAKQKKKRDK